MRADLAALQPGPRRPGGRGGAVRRRAPGRARAVRAGSRRRARRAPSPRCAASCAPGGPAPSGPRPSCCAAAIASTSSGAASPSSAAALDELQHDCHACELVETPLVEEIERAERHRGLAETELGSCTAARQQAAEEASALAARVEALQLALDAARARAGAERLAGADGVLGTLLDLIRIDAGWEAAVEAALGEALSAVVVGDPAAASRGARTPCAGSDTTGAVLALGLPAVAGRHAAGGRRARSVRTCRADRVSVGVLLDRLLAGATRVDDLDARRGARRRAIPTPSS